LYLFASILVFSLLFFCLFMFLLRTRIKYICKNCVVLSPLANYTDRAIAAG
jgi:hypothetical protein